MDTISSDSYKKHLKLNQYLCSLSQLRINKKKKKLRLKTKTERFRLKRYYLVTSS